jgi:hypothetical protein
VTLSFESGFEKSFMKYEKSLSKITFSPLASDIGTYFVTIKLQNEDNVS